MNRAEVEEIAAQLRAADDRDEKVEPLVKQLILGMAINLARIADRLDSEIKDQATS